MANPSKRKGDKFEREVVDRFEFIPGVEAKRTGLSLQASRPEEKPGDVLAYLPNEEFPIKIECKSRAGNVGWSQLIKWLQGVDLLTLKVEGSMRPLVVMEWDFFENLIRKTYEPRPDTTGEPDKEPVDLLEGGGVGGGSAYFSF